MSSTSILITQPNFDKTTQYVSELTDGQLENVRNYHAAILSSGKLQNFCGGKASETLNYAPLKKIEYKRWWKEYRRLC